MKLINSLWLGQTTGETIASFGAARLVKKLDGQIQLIGGTADDLIAARQWCSLFAPEIVFADPPQPDLKKTASLRRTPGWPSPKPQAETTPLPHAIGSAPNYLRRRKQLNRSSNIASNP
jgi:hypothetical protein